MSLLGKVSVTLAGFMLAGLGTAAPVAASASEPVVPELRPLPLGTVKPAGWLRRQLEVQRDGLTGNLDLFWPDVRESGWIGGQAEGWERMPYWLDGAVPLAWLLDDPELTGRIRTYLDEILSRQAPDGWLGPERSADGKYQPRDPWPVFVFLKAASQYAEATGDPRVAPAMTRFFHCLNRQLAERPLFEWNRMRWQDGVLSLFWLNERVSDPFLLELARVLQQQGYDWVGHFRALPHQAKVTRWEHESHVVNNAMGVKTAAVTARMLAVPALGSEVLQAIEVLDRFHGQAPGIFSGDECFAGRMPSQGTETCAVVEYMFSLETALAVTGDPRLSDRLERIAFNAMPAAVKADWWGRQYVQQANQPVTRLSQERIYTTNGEKANLFGLETNYGCCTANLHQGWPKFVSHLWMSTGDGGLATTAYGPSRVAAALNGAEVTIEEVTEYPFDGTIEFVIHTSRPVEFPLYVRLPDWSPRGEILWESDESTKLNGAGFHRLQRTWNGVSRLQLALEMPLRVESGYNGAVRIWRGPVLYSLQVSERWRLLQGPLPVADWEILPAGPWNYALELDPAHPEESLELAAGRPGCVFCPGGEGPTLRVWGRRLPGWGLESSAAAAPPPSPVRSSEPRERLVLAPYGALKLRMTELPRLDPR